MLESVLSWLPSLSVRQGEATWQGVDRRGFGWSGRFKMQSGQLSGSLQHGAIGSLAIEGESVSFRSLTGVAWQARLPSSPEFPTLAASADSVVDALRSLRSIGSDAVEFLDAIDGTVTVLVIPGVSAFGIRTRPLDLGAVRLPSLTGDISLRNIAIDIAGGYLGLQLRLHGVEGHGDLSIESDGLVARTADPRLWMSVDAVLPLRAQTARVQIDVAEWRGRDLVVAVRRAGKPTLECAARSGLIAVTNLHFVKPARATASLQGGQVRIEMEQLTAALFPIHLPPIAADRLSATEKKLTIHAHIDAAGEWAGSARFHDSKAALQNPRLSGLGSLGTVELDPAIPPSLRVVDLEVSFPELAPVSGRTSATVPIRSADLDLSGLNLRVSTAKVRFEGSVSGGDRRVGFQVRADRATLHVGNRDIELADVTISRFEEHLGDAWSNVDERTLELRAVNELGLTVALPITETIPVGAVSIPLDSINLQIQLFELALSLGGNIKGAAKVVDALRRVLDIAKDGAGLVRTIGSITSIFGLIRIEGISLVIKPKDLKVSLDADHSEDRILGIRVEPGLEWIALDVKYSYPAPKLDDWGRRKTSTLRLAKIHLDADLPDLIVKIGFTYDSTAKRFRLETLSIHLEIFGGGLAKVEEAVQKLVFAYYGIQIYVDGIVRALNLSLPDGLPSEWDVSMLRIDKADDKVKGLRITLRAFEHRFNALV